MLNRRLWVALVLTGLVLIALLAKAYVRDSRDLRHSGEVEESLEGDPFWSALDRNQSELVAKTRMRELESEATDSGRWVYPRRSIVEGPVRSSGVMDGAAEVYGLEPEQVAAINEAVHDAREEIANLIAPNLSEVAGEEGQVVFRFDGQPDEAQAIKERLYDRLEQLAGSDFAEAGVNVFWSDSWFLMGGVQDVIFVFEPRITEEPSVIEVPPGPRLGGTYEIRFGGTGSTMGGVLEALSAEALLIDFKEVLEERVGLEK